MNARLIFHVWCLTGFAGVIAPHSASSQTTPTRLLVRAVANDAKVIGTGVGGARITVRDVTTGIVLASGVQEGSTGDTRRIMTLPRERGATVYDTEGAAGFEAVLHLAQPTQVEVLAEAPLGTEHAMQRASKTVLIVPGRDIVGEGLVIELNGFTVEIEAPARAATVSAGQALTVRARVTMLCGCPTEPGGMWNADHIDITARLVRDGEIVAETTLRFAGERSTYEGELIADFTGDAELQVIAVDEAKGNTGMAVRAVRVGTE